MYFLGIDIGYSTVKTALIDGNQNVVYSDYQFHKGKIKYIVTNMINHISKEYGKNSIKIGAITGSGKNILADHKGIEFVNEVTAVVEGSLIIDPKVSSIIELGGQSAKYITNINKNNKSGMSIAINSNCSAGTGSFLEEQIHRLDLEIEDYSNYALRAKSIPRIAGRCSVFAKTDIIHHQQEGVPIEDILLGLAYSVAKNYKSTIIKKNPIKKPVMFLGGVAYNKGMIKALTEVLKLEEKDLIIPHFFDVTSAIGAAYIAYKEKYKINWEMVFQSIRQRDVDLLLNSDLPILKGYGTKESRGKHIVKEYKNNRRKTFLGIDIGSTSTNLVILNENDEVMAYKYLKTLGNPIKAVKKGIKEIAKELGGDHTISGIGITGSGRYLIGEMLGATVIKDEITAQATATITLDPEIDTIIEIGGQDSKYIYIKDGAVKDFQMNKICAAGTGAFIEEQAKKLKLELNDFGEKALESKIPLDLGERCTVFIESSIMSHLSNGANDEDIVAGVCYSVAKNYLHKVVGQKLIGNKVSFQGGVAYNQGVVNAFKILTGKPIHILPFFSVTGAFGVAKLAADAWEEGNMDDMELKKVAEHLFKKDKGIISESKENISSKNDYIEALFLKGYTGEIDINKKTIGIPRVLFLHKLFPAFNTFFRELGFNTILTDLSNEDTITLSQEYSTEDTCYPIKLVHGHVAKLIEQGVDYIFMPSLLTMKHEISKSRRDYGCVYMQSISNIIGSTMDLDELGIELLAPVLSFKFGKKHMMETMLELGNKLGKNKVSTIVALQKGMKALSEYMKEIERIGEEKINDLKAGERAFVIITRAYGIIDPILNMGIPEKLKEMGYKVLTLSHLPAHNIDLSKEYPNMYWPFGQHMISGAQIIKEHPNLYAVYLTNHGCGPDTIISKYFEDEMGDKPYLHVEVDEHASAVGVVTRIEAFINSLKNRKEASYEKIALKNYPARIKHKKVNIIENLKEFNTSKTLFLPYLYPYSHILQKILEKKGMKVRVLPMTSYETLKRGLGYTTTKEPFSLTTIIGDVLMQNDRNIKDKLEGTFILPKTEGAEVQGQYNRVIRTILDKENSSETGIFAPFIEDIIYDRDLIEKLVMVLISGDLVELVPLDKREKYLGIILSLVDKGMLNMKELEKLCRVIRDENRKRRFDKKILATGEPLVLYNDFLNQRTLRRLEEEGYFIVKGPLSEYMWALWSQYLEQPNKNKINIAIKNCEFFEGILNQAHYLLENISPFTESKQRLLKEGNELFQNYLGANGRYRFAKIMADNHKYKGIITLASMYENTSTISKIMEKNSKAVERKPILNLTFDGTINEQVKTKIESFMYYL